MACTIKKFQIEEKGLRIRFNNLPPRPNKVLDGIRTIFALQYFRLLFLYSALNYDRNVGELSRI
ncbi:hypothetical protein HOF92_05475 [bacterium]|nr:hypothetical protein [bacterium]